MGSLVCLFFSSADSQCFFLSPSSSSLSFSSSPPVNFLPILKKISRSDSIPPYFLHLAAGLIAQPVSHICNISTQTNTVPDVRKTAFTLPLEKCGYPTLLTNYELRAWKKAFSYNAPYTWNELQQYLKLCSLNELKGFLINCKDDRQNIIAWLFLLVMFYLCLLFYF